MKLRTVERASLTAGAFEKMPPTVPRSLRRSWSRIAQKVARRTLNKTWSYPLTTKDHGLNSRLRNEGLLLDQLIEPFLPASYHH